MKIISLLISNCITFLRNLPMNNQPDEGNQYRPDEDIPFLEVQRAYPDPFEEPLISTFEAAASNSDTARRLFEREDAPFVLSTFLSHCYISRVNSIPYYLRNGKQEMFRDNLSGIIYRFKNILKNAKLVNFMKRFDSPRFKSALKIIDEFERGCYNTPFKKGERNEITKVSRYIEVTMKFVDYVDEDGNIVKGFMFDIRHFPMPN